MISLQRMIKTQIWCQIVFCSARLCGFRMFKRMAVVMLINLMVKGRLRSEMVCVCQRLFWILLKVSGFKSNRIAGK